MGEAHCSCEIDGEVIEFGRDPADWTKAQAQGWYCDDTGAIVADPDKEGGEPFKDDDAAIDFVMAEAQKGDELAMRATTLNLYSDAASWARHYLEKYRPR